MNNQTKQCIKCYHTELTTAIFCSICGNRFQTNNVVETKKNASQTPIIIGAIAVIAFMGMLFVSVLLSSLSFAGKSEQKVSTSSITPKSGEPEIPAQFISDNQIKIVGKVVGVSDGDTVTVLDENKVQHKIRLEGIDAPESKQDFGDKARKNLSDLVFGKSVTVISNKKDKYNRVVGKIMLDGKDINLEQLKSGYAWHYKAYAKEQTEADQKLYSDAEISAKSGKLNLWSLTNPIAPWDFRRGADVKAEDKAKIYGNKNSMIFHWFGCSGFTKISAANRVVFNSVAEAEEAGYRAAKNCTAPQPVPKIEETEETDSDETESHLYEVNNEEFSTPSVYSTPQPTLVTRNTPSPTPRVLYSDPEPTNEVESRSSASATARCADGTYSYSLSRQGTCSHHGGVAEWNPSTSSSRTAPAPIYSAPSPTYSSPSTAPKTVHVNGYFRRDGTYVRPHTRSAPRRRN